MSVETITILLSAMGIVVTFSRGMVALGAWIIHRMDGLRAELKGDVAEVRTEVKSDIAELRTEVAEVRGAPGWAGPPRSMSY